MTELTLYFYKKKIEQNKQIIKDLIEDGKYEDVGIVKEHIKYLKSKVEEKKEE